MGKEFRINSIEEMCDLMCDNRTPDPKYYVIRTTRTGIMYKRTKCLDKWSRTPEGCWQYSKQGAQKIADRLNAHVNPRGDPWWKIGIHYSIKEVL